MNFKPLIDIHIHSYYSLLDGVNSPLEIIKTAKKHGAEAVVITDHANMAGCFEFYLNCQKEKIKPIIGCELYMKENLKDNNKKLKYFHGIFIAQNRKGLENLFKLSSMGYKEGHFEFNRPIVSFDDILKHSEGLIFTIGCMQGISGAVFDIPYDKTCEMIEKFYNVFKDRMYIEIAPSKVDKDWNRSLKRHMPIDAKEYTFDAMTFQTNCLQEIHNKRALYLAIKYNLPVVLGTDAHMVSSDLKPIQDLLIKSAPYNKDGWHFGSIHSMLSSEEAWQLLQINHPYIPIDFFQLILDNNQKLADSVEEYNLTFNTIIPKFKLSNHTLYKEGMTERELMLAIIVNLNRLPNNQMYVNRLKEELTVICDNGLADYTNYFLILSDIVRFAKENDVTVGPGRGSVGGCLLAYLLGITDIDPIKYGLSFARFLNAGRLIAGHPPDIDLDFSNRDRVIQYIFDTYGEEHAAMVGTLQTIRIKAALKDIVRHIKYNGKLPNSDEIHKITAIIPTAPQMYPSELEYLEGFTDDDGIKHKGLLDENRLLATYLDSNKSIGNPPMSMMHILRQILEKPRYQSKHAGGIVITPEPIDTSIPTRYFNSQKCTQVDYRTLERIGGMKIDILGVNTLNYISDAIKLIKQRHNVDCSPWYLKDDSKVYKMLGNGDTATVFQFDTNLVRPYLTIIKPTSISDLALITSVVRPGGIDSVLSDGVAVAEHFILRKIGKEKISYLDPLLEPILKETYGLVVYQEQITKIFEVIGGFTETEADDARRAIGKKDLKVLLSLKGRLFQYAQGQHKWQLEKCESLWNSFIGAANYAFNKAHAIGYSMLAYACAYFKYHYPLEWWSAVLSHSDSDKIKQYLNNVKDVIIPPNVNKPNCQWVIEGKKLVTPLTLVRGLGETVVQEIQKAHAESPFKSFEDFYKRVNKTRVNRGIILNLIVTSCFEGLYYNSENSTLIKNNIERVIDCFMTLRNKKNDILPPEYTNLDNRLKKISLRAFLLPIFTCNYLYEFEDVISKLSQYKKDNKYHVLGQYRIFEDWKNLPDNGFAIVGAISRVESKHFNDKKTGKRKQYLRVTLENDANQLKMVLWPNVLTPHVKSEFKENNLMIIVGRLKINKFNNVKDLEYIEHVCLFNG